MPAIGIETPGQGRTPGTAQERQAQEAGDRIRAMRGRDRDGDDRGR